jgi:predicted RNA-binding protein with PIN domain
MLIIDGYNMLHASGVFGEATGSRGFEASRRALLDHLVDLLAGEAEQTTVVFDAANAPDGLPARFEHAGITVWFAREYPDADSLIEELIEGNQAPQHLVIVSSDRRLQAAARRRRARAVPCEVWLAERRAARRTSRHRQQESKPPEPDGDEVQHWKRYFEIE